MRNMARIMAVAGIVLACVSGAHGVNMLLVPVGNPGNADDVHNAGHGGVDYSYRIGKYEVTAGQYTEFLNAVADTDTYGLYHTSMWSDAFGCKIQRSGSSGTYAYSVATDWANRPVNFVSRGDAARFANWLENGQPTGAQDLTTTEDGSYYLNGATSHFDLINALREPDAGYVIPTQDEWYKAAYYDGASGVYYDYATGTDTMPSNNLVNPDPGNNASYFNYPFDWTIGSPYYRTVGGEFENSESPYGTFDQSGNVFEWNEGFAGGWTIRGGSFWNAGSWMAAGIGDSKSLTWYHHIAGFRVAEVPEPATAALLALGGLALLRRRRRSRPRSEGGAAIRPRRPVTL